MSNYINTRCPFHNECGRVVCQHQGVELQCEYYKWNAYDGACIPDQEDLRNMGVSFSYSDESEPSMELEMLPVDAIRQHPDNPRKQLGDLTELTESIRANGIYQNLTVVPHPYEDGAYTVVIGHRRLAAAKAAGVEYVPCMVVEMSERDQLRTMMLENMQRVDLTPYEQAQGFQLMIDMGDTVEDISASTGFTTKTVKKRLKMAELDSDLLKAASERQVSLADFDQLAKIEDLDERNACLEHIGTNNFELKLKRAIRRQEIAKMLPTVKSWLRSVHAKKISNSESWSCDYEQIGTSLFINEEISFPEVTGDVFYVLDDDYGQLKLYRKRKRAAPQKRPQAEIEREKATKEANEKCKELDELFRSLRADFAKDIRCQDKGKLLLGAMNAITASAFSYRSTDSNVFYELSGVERSYSEDRRFQCIAAVKENLCEITPQLIYAAFADNGRDFSHSTYTGIWPKHERNIMLELLYEWLVSLGYQMSDEEKAMQDGTHEIFINPYEGGTK